MKKPSGFTLIEALLILVIAGMLGGVGWYVWDTNSKTSKTLDNTNAVNNAPEATPKKPTDPTAGWTAYSSKEGVYSLKYPASWHRPSSEELCTPGLLMLGPTKDSTGKCASEAFGQMYILSLDVGGADDVKLKVNDGYKNIQSKKATVDGVAGIRQSGTAIGQDKINELAPLPDNTKVVVYIFFTKGKVYAATYRQADSDKDVLADFDLMVSKTLKFSS